MAGVTSVAAGTQPWGPGQSCTGSGAGLDILVPSGPLIPWSPRHVWRLPGRGSMVGKACLLQAPGSADLELAWAPLLPPLTPWATGQRR